MSCRKAATAATYGVCACTPRGADHWSPARPPPTLTLCVNRGSRVSGWGSTRDKGRFARWGNSYSCRTQSPACGIRNKNELFRCALSPCRLSASPPLLTHSVNIGKGAFGHPRLTKTNICRGGVSPPAPAQSQSFLYSIKFLARFSLQEGGAKKSYQKKRRKGDAKRGLFEKSPLLNSRKNFPATVDGTFGVCT